MIKIGDNVFLIGLNRCKKKHINNCANLWLIFNHEFHKSHE